MSKMRLVIALYVLALPVTALHAAEADRGEAAEANPEILVNTIRANRKAMVAVNLDLSDDEAAKFWPIYDRYQKEANALGDRLVGVIEDYAASFPDLSNEKAMKLVEDYLSIEAERMEVRRAYVDEFAKVLPGRTVARFYQLENKMDAVLRYDLAATIPVVEEKRGVPTE
jgi:hypothetical protein